MNATTKVLAASIILSAISSMAQMKPEVLVGGIRVANHLEAGDEAAFNKAVAKIALASPSSLKHISTIKVANYYNTEQRIGVLVIDKSADVEDIEMAAAQVLANEQRFEKLEAEASQRIGRAVKCFTPLPLCRASLESLEALIKSGFVPDKSIQIIHIANHSDITRADRGIVVIDERGDADTFAKTLSLQETGFLVRREDRPATTAQSSH